MNELNCFKCDREMESVNGEDAHDNFKNTPYKGTIFNAYGQYGSTIFDPLDGITQLEITICDDCLYKGRNQVLQVEVQTELSKYTYSKWEPNYEPR